MKNRREILELMAAGDLSADEGEQALKEWEESRANNLYCKVAEKGGLSIYRLGRMPTTLFPDQWVRVYRFFGELLDFMEKNKAKFRYKDNATQKEVWKFLSDRRVRAERMEREGLPGDCLDEIPKDAIRGLVN